MTLQLHKKLRITLRRTFSEIAAAADNGLSTAAVLVASGLALAGLTQIAQADGWQGRHAQSAAVEVAAVEADEVQPAITLIPSAVSSESNSAAIHRVSYTANDNLRWAQPTPAKPGVKTYRQTVRRTPAPNTLVQGGSSAYSDPFGDRPSRASAYGANLPTTPSTNPPANTPVPLDAAPEITEEMPDIELPTDPVAPALDDSEPDVALPTTPSIPSAPDYDAAPSPITPIPMEPSATAGEAGNKFLVPTTPNLERRSISPDDDAKRRLEEVCPSVSSLKPISKITNDISASAGSFPKECLLEETPFVNRQFAPICYTWTAPGLAINPLYFEDASLERYGHSWGTILQPIVSAGEFVVTIPCLPWLMAIDPPNECQYTLGYYRPGECAPYIFDPIPFSVRAAVVEGGVATALIFLIP